VKINQRSSPQPERYTTRMQPNHPPRGTKPRPPSARAHDLRLDLGADDLDEIDGDEQLALVWCETHAKWERHWIPLDLRRRARRCGTRRRPPPAARSGADVQGRRRLKATRHAPQRALAACRNRPAICSGDVFVVRSPLLRLPCYWLHTARERVDRGE
jgi:hypothetical protein